MLNYLKKKIGDLVIMAGFLVILVYVILPIWWGMMY